MRNSVFRLAALAAVGVAAACPRPAAAYIGILPPTLGNLCRQATHVYVLKVEKFSPENGVILFKSGEPLKAEGTLPGAHTKHVIGANVPGARIVLDWAAEGKTAVLFARDYGVKSAAHVYIDGYWYLTFWNRDAACWFAANGEPTMLMRYCGTAEQLAGVLPRILRGEEVVVPAMVSDNRQDLEQRRARVQEVRAGLKILGDPKQNVERDLKSDGKQPEPDGKQPDKKPEPGDRKPDGKPPEKKGEERKADLGGTVKAVAADGKSFTLLGPPAGKSPEPTVIDIRIGENAKITDGDADGKLAVGQTVYVWLGKGEPKVATGIRIFKPTEKKPAPEDKGKKPPPDAPEKKPDDKKGEVRKPDLVGTVKALAADGKSFTLLPPPSEKNPEPTPIDVQIGENAKITDGNALGKLAVGQTVNVWLGKGEPKVATGIRIGKLPENPEKKPEPGDKKPEKKPEDRGGKPAPDAKEPKPEEPKKPKAPAGPVRDPAPTAAVIDAEIDRRLAADRIPASPRADDAEFLRRVYLDLTGRIPTYQQAVAFLDSKDSDKRRKLIDELLDSPTYGEHLADVWRPLLVPRELNLTGKGGGQRDTFSPWLAEQFNDNRGWNAVVADLLTAEGTPTDNPATAFLLANGTNSRPQPAKVAGSVSGLFWGVNLRCAECHFHPFVEWRQRDFWGVAAFFGKVQYSGSKSGRPTLTEVLTTGPGSGKDKGEGSAAVVRGTAIVIPFGSGKSAGQEVRARFLGGPEPALDEKEPFRPAFATWATAADNPYFARAAVNRTWAHFFGRGFVNPLDGFDESNPPSHPELLDRLAREFVASGFDLKHLARCITTSKAYQRTSRPVPGNEADAVAFSRMAVKVLTPEVFCDALSVVTKGGPEKPETRDQFVRAFRTDEEASPTDYLQGIPQMLRLMNAPSRNGGKDGADRAGAAVEQLVRSGAGRAEAITTLYLTVLSRRPTAEEVELMTGYLSRRKDDREGYRGVLWILLNSSEFALNR